MNSDNENATKDLETGGGSPLRTIRTAGFSSSPLRSWSTTPFFTHVSTPSAIAIYQIPVVPQTIAPSHQEQRPSPPEFTAAGKAPARSPRQSQGLTLLHKRTTLRSQRSGVTPLARAFLPSEIVQGPDLAGTIPRCTWTVSHVLQGTSKHDLSFASPAAFSNLLSADLQPPTPLHTSQMPAAALLP